MSSQPLLDDKTRQRVAEIFRRYGVDSGVRSIDDSSGDEIIFVVSPDDAAMMREAPLTRALVDLLGRKVWVTTDEAEWSGSRKQLE